MKPWCGTLQYKDSACYKLRKCQLQHIPMASLVSYVPESCSFTVLPGNQGMWGSFKLYFLCQHSI